MKEPLATSLNVSIIARGNATLLVIGDGGNKSDYEAVAMVLEMEDEVPWDCQDTRGYPIPVQPYRAEGYSCFNSLPMGLSRYHTRLSNTALPS
jgi:hypothetical protein